MPSAPPCGASRSAVAGRAWPGGSPPRRRNRPVARGASSAHPPDWGLETESGPSRPCARSSVTGCDARRAWTTFQARGSTSSDRRASASCWLTEMAGPPSPNAESWRSSTTLGAAHTARCRRAGRRPFAGLALRSCPRRRGKRRTSRLAGSASGLPRRRRRAPSAAPERRRGRRPHPPRRR